MGAHYTSEENILKLIKPLFLDSLWTEFEKVKSNKTRLLEFHKKLRTLTFLDPACGCGNFLVITYRELRLLELALLRALHKSGQQVLDVQSLISVDVDQFYGIEIEEFPAQIAQVALWLTDHQMNMKVSQEFGSYFARIPLKATPHIVCGNALTLDWTQVLSPEKCNYILGNPPFVGAKFMDDTQRQDARIVFNALDNGGLLDFVAAWYVKAARYMQENKQIKCAFVSTNSITQGEQVGVLWSWMLSQGIKIHFAHRTFSWSNEARGKAAVHCVIIGFGLHDVVDKTIYEYADIKGEPLAIKSNNINPYLVNASNVILPRRSKPISNVPTMVTGNKPIDDGNFLFTSEQKNDYLKIEPSAQKWFRRWLGGEEFINNIERWCLWLGECPPDELRQMPEAVKRIHSVQKFRNSSNSLPTKKLAATPTRFHTEFIPDKLFIAMPQVSSERRKFIPIAFLSPEFMCGDKLRVIENPALWHFGILNSTFHMAWTRQVCGRLKSDYQYSALIVYNNFPWPELNAKNKAKIESAAQTVLDARAIHTNASLADLYDPLTMPANLLKAHQALDKVVDAAYGYKSAATDAARVAFLFERYQQITSLLPAIKTKAKRSAKNPAKN